jgi:K+/H+ antiporter YhaU regulatory subunit KhtT
MNVTWQFHLDKVQLVSTFTASRSVVAVTITAINNADQKVPSPSPQSTM